MSSIRNILQIECKFLCPDMRAKYRESHEAFTENQLVSRDDPFMQFKAWFDEAKCTKEIIEPTAVCLATASK